MFRAVAIPLLCSCQFLSSGALESPDLLLSYFMLALS